MSRASKRSWSKIAGWLRNCKQISAWAGEKRRKPTRKGRLLAGSQGSSKGLVIALVRLRATNDSVFFDSHSSRSNPIPRAHVDTVQTGRCPVTLPRSVLRAQKSNGISKTGKITTPAFPNLPRDVPADVDS